MRSPVALLALILAPQLSIAQGVTTAAIQGTVAGHDRSPIGRALVTVTNTATGRRWSLTTSSGGRYALEDAAVGGPYRIEVRALGFGPEARAGISLALGQRLIADFALQPAPIQLSAVRIAATADGALNPGRTGPAQIITSTKMTTLPNIGRDFVSATLLSPQAAIVPSTRLGQTEGVTIAGQNRLLNAFQIDGGVNQDLYSGRMQPGLQTWPRPISLEAIEEIQVLAAPVDVRYGGFAGGVVNSVTKSGTNAIHGSVFSYRSDAAWVGRNATGSPVGDFAVSQFGGSIGGPILRDRMQYFVSGDIYRRSIADAGPLIADTIGGADLARIGIGYASATRFQDILYNRYGLDPGTLGPYQGSAPAVDVFGKISAQLATNSHLELSHHYVDGERKTYIVRQYGSYFLSSVGQRVPATEHASRLIWSTLLGGRWSNELIASHLTMSEACRPNAPYALINVPADQGMLAAGTSTTCPSASTQRDFEITENLTVDLRGHLVTIGAHAEALQFQDAQLQGSAGLWNFRNLDSLQVGHAAHYERTLPATVRGRAIGFGPRQLALYLQDRWRPKSTLTLTMGLRMDVTSLPDRVVTNESLRSALGVDNGRLPSASPLWSPRFGVNYDVAGQGRTFLRAGIGLFTGRPVYTWVASAYRDDGLHQLFLSCDGSRVPPFDPANQPATCLDGAAPPPRLSFFDRDVRSPQTRKTFLGIDQRLPGNIIAALDLLYTRARHQLYFSDANLLSPTDSARGEGNRLLYGTLAASGSATAARRATLGQVVRASNRSGDHSTSIAVQMRKAFADRGALSALYAHTRAQDRMSVVNALAKPNLETTPLDGALDQRRLATSSFEITHRVDVDGSLELPYRVVLSLRYSGASGTPYTYTIRGDANADGIGSGTMTNDVVYVPRNRSDISIDGNGTVAGFGTAAQQDSVYDTVLNPFIEREACLRLQRGRILARNSCRNPWFGTLNARAMKVFPTISGQSLELTADVYNVLNLFNRAWGQYRVTTLDPGVPMVFLSGYDTSIGRGVYRPQLPGFRQIQDLASRWQTELGLRYVF